MANRIEIEVRATNKASPVFKTVISDAEGMFGKIASVAGGMFAGNLLTRGFDGFKNGIKSSVGLASDFNESANKAREVFGGAFNEIERFGQGAPKALGLSQRAALEAAGTFGNMFDQLRIGNRDSAAMSTSMVQLASDFASFHNADITQVIQAQNAAFRGEYDALQRFLPTINAAAVEQTAMEMTGKKNATQLTAQEKALATYQLMLAGAGKAQGDFARTADQGANTSRRFKAAVEELSVTFGRELEPTVKKAMNAIVDKIQDPAFEKAVREKAKAIVNFGSDVDKGFGKTVVPAFEWIINNETRLTAAIAAIGLAFAWANPVGAGIAASVFALSRIGDLGSGKGITGTGGPGSEGLEKFIREKMKTDPDYLLKIDPKFSKGIDPSYFPQGYGPPVPPPVTYGPPVPDWTPPVKAALAKLIDVFLTAGDTLRDGLSKVDAAISGLYSRPSIEQAQLKILQAEDKRFKAQFGDKAVHFGPGEGKGTPERLQKQLDILDAQHDLEKARLVVLDQTLKTEAQLELDRAELAKKIPIFTLDVQNAATALGVNLTPGLDALNTTISGPQGVNSAFASAKGAVWDFVNFVKRNMDLNADTLTPGGTFDLKGEQTALPAGPGR